MGLDINLYQLKNYCEVESAFPGMGEILNCCEYIELKRWRNDWSLLSQIIEELEDMHKLPDIVKSVKGILPFQILLTKEDMYNLVGSLFLRYYGGFHFLRRAKLTELGIDKALEPNIRVFVEATLDTDWTRDAIVFGFSY